MYAPLLVWTPWSGGLLQGRCISELMAEAIVLQHTSRGGVCVCQGRDGTGSLSLAMAWTSR
jgi:hypothetical protein